MLARELQAADALTAVRVQFVGGWPDDMRKVRAMMAMDVLLGHDTPPLATWRMLASAADMLSCAPHLLNSGCQMRSSMHNISRAVFRQHRKTGLLTYHQEVYLKAGIPALLEGGVTDYHWTGDARRRKDAEELHRLALEATNMVASPAQRPRRTPRPMDRLATRLLL